MTGPYRRAKLTSPKKPPMIRWHKVLPWLVGLLPFAIVLGVGFAINWKGVLAIFAGVSSFAVWVLALSWLIDRSRERE